MAEVQLTASERAVLIVLMAEARELSTLELQREFGVMLHGESRRRLNELGLIESHRQARLFVHTLTDYGWHYCRTEFASGHSPLPGQAGGAMMALLRGVGRFLDKTGYTLADVFDLPDRPADTTLATDNSREIGDRIRRVYATLSQKSGPWIRLSQLRPMLGSVPYDATDSALRILARDPQVLLVPESNQKALTEADRRAAIHIGGEAKHLIAIGAE